MNLIECIHNLIQELVFDAIFFSDFVLDFSNIHKFVLISTLCQRRKVLTKSRFLGLIRYIVVLKSFELSESWNSKYNKE